MENAGSMAAREIMNSFLPELQKGKIAILAGPGNNGADAFVVARHLVNLGIDSPEVFYVGKTFTPLHQMQRERAVRQKIVVREFESVAEIKGFDIYVDGLFGVGLNRTLEKPFSTIIENVNSFGSPIISLDLPSGLDGLTGKYFGVSIKAHMTLTFGAAKVGLYTTQGSSSSGRVRVIPIGIPLHLIGEIANTHFLVNEKWVRPKLPVRKKAGNKFDSGRVYIFAGHPGTWGAAALCCQGAYRIGAGYVTLITESKADSEKYLGKDLGPEVLLTSMDNPEILEKADAVVVGPGVGRTETVKAFIEKLILAKIKNVVVDADGLRVLSQMKNVKIPSSWILTPHSGELADLIGVSSTKIDEDRLAYCKKASDVWGCHVLLKGFRSIVSTPDGHSLIIDAGNSALAKAGTGDVLSGFIGALLGQGLNAVAAVAAGAFIHGRVADYWIKNGGNNKTLLASDLPQLISNELNRLES
jgi:hydroxyethylthiazole kinase-like uncharacterized protein yjeF